MVKGRTAVGVKQRDNVLSGCSIAPNKGFGHVRRARVVVDTHRNCSHAVAREQRDDTARHARYIALAQDGAWGEAELQRQAGGDVERHFEEQRGRKVFGLHVEGPAMPRDVTGGHGSAEQSDFGGSGAHEGYVGKNKVGRTVKVERNEPGVCGVYETLLRSGAHGRSDGNGAGEMLVEVDVEDVADEACDRDAVVADIQVVHENEVHAGKLSDKCPARRVVE